MEVQYDTTLLLLRAQVQSLAGEVRSQEPPKQHQENTVLSCAHVQSSESNYEQIC